MLDKEAIEAAALELLDEMEGDQGDGHEIYLKLRQTLDNMRAMGMPPPDDLVRMETEMSAEFRREAT